MAYLQYIFKRIGAMIPVIIGISFILFSILVLTPGDPARTILGEMAPEEDVIALREEMGFNDPLFIRYFRYVRDALHGDFGKSYTSGQPVVKEMADRMATTLLLATGSLVYVILLGVPIGILAAVKQYSLSDIATNIITFILTAMPSFWLGLLCMLLFGLKLRWLPATGSETILHFIMPCIVLSGPNMAAQLRMTRSSMLEVIRQDYMRTARSKGVSERRIIFQHGLRNAMIPILTMLGINLTSVIGTAFVVEQTFAMAGLGSLLITGVKAKDIPIVMAIVLFIACCICIINLIVDLLYAVVDPRIRAQIQKK